MTSERVVALEEGRQASREAIWLGWEALSSLVCFWLPLKRELKVLADVSARAKAITKRLLNKGPSLIFSFSCSYIQIRVFCAEILVTNSYA